RPCTTLFRSSSRSSTCWRRRGRMAQETHQVEHAHEGGHASLRTYVVIGVILTVVTAIEGAISYIPAMEPVEVPLLLALSFAKFMLVVLFYMHLKFARKLFSRVFCALSRGATLLISGLLLFSSVLGDYRVWRVGGDVRHGAGRPGGRRRMEV